MRSQLLDGNSQSDVTVQDVEELSRAPKRTMTAHEVGHCQKLCNERGKVKGPTVVIFFVSTSVGALSHVVGVQRALEAVTY